MVSGMCIIKEPECITNNSLSSYKWLKCFENKTRGGGGHCDRYNSIMGGGGGIG